MKLERWASKDHALIVGWGEIERAWLHAVTDAIVATVESNPEERFYAGAFWMLYGDYSSLHVPVFGLNSEDSPSDIRWHPPDWRWSIIDAAHERVRPLYEPLSALQVDEGTYPRIWEEHIDMLSRVCRRVTASVRTGQMRANEAAFSRQFFVAILDFSQGDDAVGYLKRSVDEETLAVSGVLDQVA